MYTHNRTQATSFPIYSGNWTETPVLHSFDSSETIDWTKVKSPKQSPCHHVVGRAFDGTGAMQRVSRNFKFSGTTLMLDSTRTEWGGMDLISPSLFELPMGEPDRARSDAALSVMETGFQKPILDLPLFVCEFKDTAKMIGELSSRVARLVNFVEHLISETDAREYIGRILGQTGRGSHYLQRVAPQVLAGKIMHGMTLKQMSRDWLLLQLGIAPTISDAQALGKLAGNILGVGPQGLGTVTKKGTVVRCGYRVNPIPAAPVPSSWEPWSYLRNNWTTGYLVPTTRRACGSVVSGVVSGRLTEALEVPSTRQLKHMLGLDAGPLKLAWEATKLSWLVDYFIGVGSVLDRIARYQVACDRSIEWDDGIWDSFRTATVDGYYPGNVCTEGYLDPDYPPPNPLYRFRWRTEFGGFEPLSRTSEFLREPVGNSLAMGRMILGSLRGPRLSPIRLGTIAAMVHQTWSGKAGSVLYRTGIRSS